MQPCSLCCQAYAEQGAEARSFCHCEEYSDEAISEGKRKSALARGKAQPEGANFLALNGGVVAQFIGQGSLINQAGVVAQFIGQGSLINHGGVVAQFIGQGSLINQATTKFR